MVDFRIDVIVDPGRARSGVQGVEKQLDGIERRASNARNSIAKLFGLFSATAATVSAVRTLASFDQAIARAGAVSSASADQFQALSDRARELGATTRFTATDAAEGLTFLAQAGFSVEQSLATVDDALRLAQVGSLSLAESADIATNVLSGFNLGVNDAARFVDVLAKAANSSNTNVRQLGDAFSFVAPIAQGVGVSIEEAAAAIGVLSNAGIQGSRAGTGLQRVISRLSNPTAEAVDVLNQLGLTQEQVNIETQGLTTVLERLAQSGISATQALVLAGDRGGPAITALTNSVPQLRELNKQLNDATGFADKTAAVLDDTLQGALRRVASAYEAVILAFGQTGVTDTLRVSLEGVAIALRVVAENAETALLVIVPLSAALATLALRSAVLAGASLLRLSALFGTTATAATGATAATAGFSVASAGLAASVGLAAGGIFILSSRINQYNRDLEEIGKTIKAVEEDQKLLSSSAVQLTMAQRELNNLNRIIQAQQERGVEITASQAERQKFLQGRVEELSGALKEQQTAQRDATSALRGNKQPLDEQQQALARQRAVLEGIRGPQREFAQFQEDLKALLDQNLISLQEYNTALADAGGGQQANPLGDQQQSLEDEIAVLRTRISLGDQIAEAQRIQLSLRREGVELSNSELQDIFLQIQERDNLNKIISDGQKAELEAQRAIDQAKRDAEERERTAKQTISRVEQQNAEFIIRRQNGESAITDLLVTQDRLKRQGIELTAAETEELFRQLEVRRQQQEFNKIDTNLDGVISQTEALNAQIRELDGRTDFGAGISRGLLKLKQEASDLAAVGEQVVNVFADRATDAIVEFAKTGVFNFREFATQILEDLLRIIIRLLVVRALSAAIGSAGGGAGGALAGVATTAISSSQGTDGVRQRGGPVQRGRSFLVGENGPEIFTPGQSGMVTPTNPADLPPGEQRPERPINIINVQSEDQIPEAINSGQADSAIINVIQRNAQQVNQVLG
jgi:TP901 family phage tail tape measure protein/lambda family phage tail tape measure protein